MSHLLGGRLLHDQPEDGHRSGIEPVLLAASIPARPGELVLEGGAGSGAALLCLAGRVADLRGVGVERDPVRAAMARANFAANGFASLSVAEGDLVALPLEAGFHHAMANPPWHGCGTASPDPAREAARRGGDGLLAVWARALARPLRAGGTLTLVVAAGVAAEAWAALAGSGCGSLALLPLWPRAGVAARLVLARGVRGGRGPSRVLPGLVLHEADGRFTPAAEAILRDGAGLPL